MPKQSLSRINSYSAVESPLKIKDIRNSVIDPMAKKNTFKLPKIIDDGKKNCIASCMGSCN